MAKQQSVQPRYWIFKDSNEDSALLIDDLVSTGSRLRIIEPNSELRGSDVVYFWRKEDSLYFYGWGVIESEPAPLLTEGYSSSSAEPLVGVQVKYHAVFPTPVRREINEDPALKALSELTQIQESIIELNKGEAVALNRLIRAHGVESPLDPAAESPEEQAEGEDSGDRTGKASLKQLLARYSQRLSVLSRSILELAGEFATKREHNRDQVTSSCILFAAIELGAVPTNLEVENASQFLFQWLHEDQPRSRSYKRAILNSCVLPTRSESRD